ncbi:MAG TPA: Holliday junction branch migration protein RuvA [Candidatus Butyricicoccus avistercoris]|uniref:Holliday junction branch migration complex subunit RuvA n=1 Tax=Candidatus Butyricicoccus avistercoris TaxID=2838518 RepID=A0A9D1TIW4_9FIRM|nr:Holliday junction branch migration protein RuvA [Candidatus Butyricicoccus avistercoris]
MFYYVEGLVAHVEQGLAVIDCGGVGYACHTSQNTLSNIQMGEKARLYTCLHVREDIFELYGFSDQEELNCYKMLTSVSGVGPKAALSILSVAPPSQLALAIITEDEKLLTQAQGIGKKIAQRIVLELRDKMSKGQLETAASAGKNIVMPEKGGINHIQEAVAALMVLGYSQAEAFKAMEGLNSEDMDAESIIRYCLKKLAMQ